MVRDAAADAGGRVCLRALRRDALSPGPRGAVRGLIPDNIRGVKRDRHRSWAAGLLLALVFSGGACSGDEARTGEAPTSARRGARDEAARYAVLDDPSWRLQEAVRPGAGDPLRSVERPPLVWYAEYVAAPTPSEGLMVRLSGHDVPAAQARAALEAVGFELGPVAVAGWSATGGSSPADPSGPDVLLLDHGPGSFLLLSYEVDVEALARLAARLRVLDEQGWVRVGGVLR